MKYKIFLATLMTAFILTACGDDNDDQPRINNTGSPNTNPYNNPYANPYYNNGYAPGQIPPQGIPPGMPPMMPPMPPMPPMNQPPIYQPGGCFPNYQNYSMQSQFYIDFRVTNPLIWQPSHQYFKGGNYAYMRAGYYFVFWNGSFVGKYRLEDYPECKNSEDSYCTIDGYRVYLGKHAYYPKVWWGINVPGPENHNDKYSADGGCFPTSK